MSSVAATTFIGLVEGKVVTKEKERETCEEKAREIRVGDMTTECSSCRATGGLQ